MHACGCTLNACLRLQAATDDCRGHVAMGDLVRSDAMPSHVDA
jgi:hypothetical protein